jgi:hypothetical protein
MLNKGIEQEKETAAHFANRKMQHERKMGAVAARFEDKGKKLLYLLCSFLFVDNGNRK